ncbi:MAG TPA: hypothetical protein PKD54_07230 [Pirellulaceae bacterium]|nr:hypothetical protein [Pirellulaceae bacterium]
MRRWLRWTGFVCLVGIVSIGAAYAWQDDDKIQLDSRQIMLAKVRHAKSLVEGLALENHETIAVAAQGLMSLSQESAWRVIQTPEYLSMSDEFRSSAERLRDAANQENIDLATLAYFEVTLNCVRCHKYLRRQRK